MRERIRIFVASCFYYSGLLKLAHWWERRSRQRLIILNYHHASGANLRRQMLYLRRHYRIMHLEDALQELYAPRQKKKISDRRLPMVLTFDDGYLDNYRNGLRFARELQVPITVFLIPGYIESGKYFWWLASGYLVRRSKVEKVTVKDCIYHLTQLEDRKALTAAIDMHLRHATSVAEREAFLTDIQQALEVSLPGRTEDDVNDLSLPLTWKEVHEMEQSGWVSFGAHTMHHPVLAHLSNSAEVQCEVGECRQLLEQQLGHPVRTFAYPIGKLEHIGEEGIRAVEMAGYEWALTTIEEANTQQSDPHLLRRLPGDEWLHWLVMASELVGLLGILSRFRKKGS